MIRAADIEAVYRAEAGRVRATLIRLLGGFDAAEEALHDAFAAAAEQWPRDGLPRNPRAWLVSAGRFRAIDRMRRRARFDRAAAEIARDLEQAGEEPPMDDEAIADDQLRLVFVCCHPALTPDQQVALALREICGLTTEQIAAAFFVSPSTLAQRIVRAKARIRDENLPYAVPDRAAWPERLAAVLHAVYLVFNSGYSAVRGGADLAAEAIRLGRLLVALLPAEPEALGLLALMLFNESRRKARLAETGEPVLIAEQDRTLWDTAMINEGGHLADRALALGRAGTFALQAAIAREHAIARSPDATDWGRIVRWYDALLEQQPTPIVALNRAVAIAERDGPTAGLALIDALGEALDGYYLKHSARAELCRRMGRTDAARDAYARALGLASDEADRRFLARRLEELG